MVLCCVEAVNFELESSVVRSLSKQLQLGGILTMKTFSFGVGMNVYLSTDSPL